VLLKAAELCDLFLYDLKVLDPQKHRTNTGVDNRPVLDNLLMLSASGADIVIRMPLIPTVNDSEEDIAAAAKFIAELPRTHPVHLLPYHRAANSKYLKLGMSYRGENVLPPPEEQVTHAAQRLSNFGLTVEVGG
jgi:pyruvate formate lyase activating enzyme